MIDGALVAWREVRGIVMGLLATAAAGFMSRQRWLTFVALGLFAWVCYFFRDPERVPDNDHDALILAPADGRITKIEQVDEPHFMQAKVQRITIFLSLFDVHVQRMPYAGSVDFLHYQPGNFAPAFLQHADENEANYVGITTTHGKLLVTQMTGILARRIVCWPVINDILAKGERFGLIKFGSRVDLYLPLDCEIAAEVGEQVYGGQTPMARWGER